MSHSAEYDHEAIHRAAARKGSARLLRKLIKYHSEPAVEVSPPVVVPTIEVKTLEPASLWAVSIDQTDDQVEGELARMLLSYLRSETAERRILDKESSSSHAYQLRRQQPGDLGWVVSRQALLYSAEYGWDETYEALAAEIVAQFIEYFDPKRERCWIAEIDGTRVGAVILAKASDEVAKLRLLHVEPEARGHGIGKCLVDECIRFARQAGYQKMTLWTQSILHPARHIYKQAGFQLVCEEPHHSFGKDLVAETWELELG